MPDGQDQEKTEPATSKRRNEARKKGTVALSKEVPSVVILLTALGVFSLAGTTIFTGVADLMRETFQNAASLRINSAEDITSAARVLFGQIFFIIFPLMFAVLIAGVVSHVAQIGFLFTGETLSPKLDKLNPIQGMKKLFSSRALVEVVKSLLKMIIVGGVAYLVVKKRLDDIPGLMALEVGGVLAFIGKMSFEICLYVSLVLIILAGFDYAYQKWKHENDLKMTKQEVKDEHKQQEGDPKIKARIRSIQMEMARKRMMEAVPQATVVITNPTHLAIALKYEMEEMVAPQIMAKGAGFVAEKIKEIAKENNIPIIEQKPLAQALFKSVEPGDLIPAELYRAVAEILAYVYRLKGRVK